MTVHKVWLALFLIMPISKVLLPSSVSANPAAPLIDRSFSTVSLNVAKESDPRQIVDAIRNAPRLRDSDLYLFQEVRHEKGHLSVAEQAAQQLGYSVAFAPAAKDVYDQGLAVISRYPLCDIKVKSLKACDLRFRSRTRFALAATVQTPWGDLRAWNVHLDTRINPGERLDQLQPVLDDAASHVGPRVIGGDFNTNDLYWFGNVVPLPLGAAHCTAVRGAMLKNGFETPFSSGLSTFKTFGRQLDWIYLNGLHTVASSVEPAPFSDHHAIWVHARL